MKKKNNHVRKCYLLSMNNNVGSRRKSLSKALGEKSKILPFLAKCFTKSLTPRHQNIINASLHILFFLHKKVNLDYLVSLSEYKKQNFQCWCETPYFGGAINDRKVNNFKIKSEKKSQVI